MKTIFSVIFILVLFLIIFSTSAFAANLNVDCESSSCVKIGEDNLFNITTDGMWYPGRSLVKTISLKNSNTDSRSMHLRSSQVSGELLQNIMNIKITNGSNVVWSGTLENFLGQRILLGIFSAGEVKEYSFEVSMKEDAGNLYQGEGASFDLIFGFREEGVDRERSGGGAGGASNASSGDSSSNQEESSSAILSLTNNALNRLFGEDSVSEKKPDVEKRILGKENIFESCSCYRWQRLVYLLLIILLLLIFYVLKKQIRRLWLKSRQKN